MTPLQLAQGGASVEEQRHALRELLVRGGISGRGLELLEEFSAPGVMFVVGEAGESLVGAPDPVLVPSAWRWPQNEDGPLALIAEIQLDSIVGIDQLSLAQPSGSLLFFHQEAPVHDAPRLENCHVLHIPAGTPRVPSDVVVEHVGIQLHTGSNATGWTPLRTGQYRPPRIRGWAAHLVRRDGLAEAFEAADLWDDYAVIHPTLDCYWERALWFLLSGPSSSSTVGHTIRSWFTSDHDSEPDREHFSESERNGEGWLPLMNTYAVQRDDMELEWADGGSLTYCIPATDLAQWRFDRVICLLNSA
ncbi:MAG: DUF1963 domain-containing protein [Patulibacter minatonensis]